MKERYEIIKKIYPNYLILFKVTDKIKYYGVDKEIAELFGKGKLKKTNKMILNNLEIEEKEEHGLNEYDLYLAKYKLIKMIKDF
ncbi:MAG: hypothetical protein IJY87_00640 [Bacilli bacterium]|nr:hypothetical protein [Bacilli bacterium]